jgi:hypothetical protein
MGLIEESQTMRLLPQVRENSPQISRDKRPPPWKPDPSLESTRDVSPETANYLNSHSQDHPIDKCCSPAMSLLDVSECAPPFGEFSSDVNIWRCMPAFVGSPALWPCAEIVGDRCMGKHIQKPGLSQGVEGKGQGKETDAREGIRKKLRLTEPLAPR